jgi:hypothetical protein
VRVQGMVWWGWKGRQAAAIGPPESLSLALVTGYRSNVGFIHSSSLFFFFALRFWGLKGLHLEPLHQPYFCEEFFEIGSRELFAQAGFKP